MVKSSMSILLVLLAALMWGTTGTAQTFAPAGANPVVIGATRLAVGGLALLMLVFIQGKLTFKGWPLGVTLLAAFSIAAYQPLFFSAVSITGVAVGTVVAIGSAPILAGVLEWLVRRRIPERKWWAATGLAVVGCVLLFSTDQEMSISPIGVLMALGAGLSFAIYALVNKKLLEKHAPDAVVAIVFSLSALILSPLLWFYDLSWILTENGLAVTLHLGLIATALAYLLFSRGLLGIPASTGVTLSLAEPLTAAMLGVLIVGEILTPTAWLGISLLFIGLGVVSYSREKKVQ